MKTCTVCKVEKPLEEYNNKKNGKFGKAARCVPCEASYAKAWREANYEVQRAKEKTYKLENREAIRERERAYYWSNPQRESDRKKKFRRENPSIVRQQLRTRRQKPEIKARNREYVKNRRKTNPQFKLRTLIRSRISNVLRAKDLKKVGSGINDMGCTPQELVKHLESHFEIWMSWENHGPYSEEKRTWHIDHTVSLSEFNLEDSEQFKKACHYTNLRPLEAIKNLKKNKF